MSYRLLSSALAGAVLLAVGVRYMRPTTARLELDLKNYEPHRENGWPPVLRVYRGDQISSSAEATGKVDGFPIVEVVPAERRTTTLPPLEPGNYLVRVEIGNQGAWPPVILGAERVTLAPRQRLIMRMNLSQPPSTEASASFAGAVQLPTTWQVTDATMVLDLLRRPDVRMERTRILLEHDAKEPLVRRFSVASMIPGAYDLTVPEVEFEQLVLIPEGGIRDVHLVVGEPAEVRATVVDERTGNDLTGHAHMRWASCPESLNDGLGWLVPATAGGDHMTFRAPAGTVAIQATVRRYLTRRCVEPLHSGRNDLAIALAPGFGVHLHSSDGSIPKVQIDGPGTEVQTEQEVTLREADLWIMVSAAGRYRIALDGEGQTAPISVDVDENGFKSIDVRQFQ